ncbi:hypothetical protein LBO01_18810 [Companilactobacillus paralimentarius]|uniref:Integrase core domain protein n=2 Tax=Companilactobacillus bobalius TaxID=2801451 RepID=A0A0R1KU85_9LACO|nr:hypothetical protein ATN92_13145 [Companilactobacillus bobalius]KRK84105.1 integrase core domain protein [Companilactobacillus bobalius DSM 19674]OVE97202.1 putative transposase for insertion-like sequence element IS1161 [Companilactobacillus bobalius]GEO58752.1 hypothetical protein LBO01_18810 [Companilactobacillus paralimentarius]
MPQTKNTMSCHYQQLNEVQHKAIETLLKLKWSYRKIAQYLCCNVSTISREIKRGSTRQIGPNKKPYVIYFAETGQSIHEKRRQACHSVDWRVKAPLFFELLQEELRKKYRVHSVDSFVNWFKIHRPKLPYPSTPTVYRYIDAGLLMIKNSDLLAKLRRRVRGSYRKHARLNKHILGQSIENRPPEANKSLKIGHWEGDLVKGKRVAI